MLIWLLLNYNKNDEKLYKMLMTVHTPLLIPV